MTTARTANDNAVSAHADFSSALGTQWSKYYVYNDVLAASASRSESVAVGTGAGTYQIGATDHQAGSTSSAKTSITSPIFTGVTPSGRISVSRTLPAGSCTSVLYADGPQPGDVYRYFDFRIVIHGYGVAADSSASRAEVIVHLKEDLVLPGTADRLDVVTASASNTELKASHS